MVGQTVAVIGREHDDRVVSVRAPFQGIEQVHPLPSQDLEPSFLERFDLRDLDDDGRITSGRELFGSASLIAGRQVSNGFEALAALDESGDGAIDKRDGWTARTRDGKLSAQFEHTVLVTEGDPEILTWRERRTTA